MKERKGRKILGNCINKGTKREEGKLERCIKGKKR
jgi:hypothetical protein